MAAHGILYRVSFAESTYQHHSCIPADGHRGRNLPDVFLSYNREDQAVACRQAECCDLWWDTTLRAGEAYDEVTKKALTDAKAVVVLWWLRSAASRWVRAKEATQAGRNKTLACEMIDPSKQPIVFEFTHTADRAHWRGNSADRAWLAFLSDVHKFVEKGAPTPPKATAASPPDSNGRRFPRRPLVLSAIAVGIVLAFAAIAVITLRQGAAQPQNQRVAFFEFTADGNNPVAVSAASATLPAVSALGATP